MCTPANEVGEHVPQSRHDGETAHAEGGGQGRDRDAQGLLTKIAAEAATAERDSAGDAGGQWVAADFRLRARCRHRAGEDTGFASCGDGGATPAARQRASGLPSATGGPMPGRGPASSRTVGTRPPCARPA